MGRDTKRSGRIIDAERIWERIPRIWGGVLINAKVICIVWGFVFYDVISE